MSQSLFDLSGRVAVVTGGTTGLGHAIALGLAEAGADVVPSSRRMEQVEKVAAEIEALGRRSLRVTSDVLDRASLQALHDAVIKEFGKVDILVNAAGVTLQGADARDERGRLVARDRDESDGNAARLPDLRRRPWCKAGYGRIINIASLTTFVGFYQVAAYSASKAAVGSLTKVLAVELAKTGVNVNAIAPGDVSDAA